MKRKILNGVIVILSLYFLTACANLTIANPVKETGSDNEGEGKDIDNDTSPDIKASYGFAGVNHELINNQINKKKEGLIYYNVIFNKEKLDGLINKYNIEYESNIDSTYNHNFFDEYVLIVIYPGVTSSNLRYRVEDIKRVKDKNNKWIIKISHDIFSNITDEKVNPVIFIDMKRSLYRKTNKLDIKLLEN